jgi:hypothetical protein
MDHNGGSSTVAQEETPEDVKKKLIMNQYVYYNLAKAL